MSVSGASLTTLGMKDKTIDRILHVLFGAFLGALVALSALWWWLDEINWIFVGASAVVCAILAFAWGKPFLEWLKEAWWHT